MREINQIIARINEGRPDDPLGLPPNHTSLDILRAVYQNPRLEISMRMRAATAALQFEHPKLGVSVTIDGKDWADRLDAAIEKSRLAKLGFCPNNKMVEAKREE
jgi:hypothetical protein